MNVSDFGDVLNSLQIRENNLYAFGNTRKQIISLS